MALLETLTNPQVLGAGLAGIAVFATVMTLAGPLLKGDRLGGRMKSVALQRDVLRRKQLDELSRKSSIRGQQSGFMKRAVEQLKLRNILETPGIREKLNAAGYRGQGPVYAFLFFRFVAPILLTLGALAYYFLLSDSDMSAFFKIIYSLGIGGMGFYAPDVYVKNIQQKRTDSIMRAFPDALDLLLICVEAGMSIEVAFSRVAGEIGSQSAELAEEFSLLNAELSYLPDRRQAYDNLAKRCNHPGVKAVSTALNQAEKYGTPLATALRVMALENREMRMQAAEQKAASLPAKLTVPMILFFLPPLFVVIMGPAVMSALSST